MKAIPDVFAEKNTVIVDGVVQETPTPTRPQKKRKTGKSGYQDVYNSMQVKEKCFYFAHKLGEKVKEMCEKLPADRDFIQKLLHCFTVLTDEKLLENTWAGLVNDMKVEYFADVSFF